MDFKKSMYTFNFKEASFDITLFFISFFILGFSVFQGQTLISIIKFPTALVLTCIINFSVMINMGQVLASYRTSSFFALNIFILGVFIVTSLMLDLYLPYSLRLSDIIETDIQMVWVYVVAMTSFIIGAYYGEKNLIRTAGPLKASHHFIHRIIPRHPILFTGMIPFMYTFLMGSIAVWYVEIHFAYRLLISCLFFFLPLLGLFFLYRFLARRFDGMTVYDNFTGAKKYLILLKDIFFYMLMAILICVVSEIYIHSYLYAISVNEATPSVYRLFFILCATGLLPYRFIIAFEPPINLINFSIGGIVFYLFIESAIKSIF